MSSSGIVEGWGDGVASEMVVDQVPRFGAVDYCVFVVMLMVSMGVGVCSALQTRGKASVSEFLIAARKMPTFPVALSLIGGVISALSILGNATEVYLYGTQITTNLVGCVLGVIFIHTSIIPILFRLNLVSLVEYLQLRFQSTHLRKMATACQLLFMFFYLGICLYAPSLAIASVTRLPTWASVIALGVICTFYVSIGGVRAVVYTDVVQTVLMFVGVLVTVIKVCVDMGGPAVVWETAEAGNRVEFFNLDPSPYTRHTFWTTVSNGVFVMVSTVALSQPQFQRFASVGEAAQCSWLLKIFLAGLVVLWGLFYLSGLIAYAAYSTCDPLTSARIEKADQIIPYLVMDYLTSIPGLPGLFVAAVYGGVLSSMSSQANSVACLVWEDFLKHSSFFASLSDSASTTVVKLITAVTGLSAMGVAMAVGSLGSLFSVAYTVAGAIMGPQNGLFIAGIFVPWANKTGAIVGFLASFALNLWMVVGKVMTGGTTPPYLPLSTSGCPEVLLNLTSTAAAAATVISDVQQEPHPLYDISYCYNGLIGIFTTVIVCSIVSLFTGPIAPGEVDQQLVSPTAAWLHRSLWRWLRLRPCRSHAPPAQVEEGQKDSLHLHAPASTSTSSSTETKSFTRITSPDLASTEATAI